MGKKKKEPKLGIKTARYFTKNCSNCNFEYPNWFVNCPKCGAAWDNVSHTSSSATAPEVAPNKKNIKIVVKVTEEDFNEAIDHVVLIFSADKGKAWYQMKMDTKMDYFIAEIAEVPIGSVIIYYIEVFLESGEKVIENNEGKFFYYEVGIPIEKVTEEPPKTEAKAIQDNVAATPPAPQEYKMPAPQPVRAQPKQESNEGVAIFSAPQKKVQDDGGVTIFGKPQINVDPDLKTCPNCNSKIKKMWSTCPICGKKV